MTEQLSLGICLLLVHLLHFKCCSHSLLVFCFHVIGTNKRMWFCHHNLEVHIYYNCEMQIISHVNSIILNINLVLNHPWLLFFLSLSSLQLRHQVRKHVGAVQKNAAYRTCNYNSNMHIYGCFSSWLFKRTINLRVCECAIREPEISLCQLA